MEASEKKVSTRVRGAAWRRKDAPKARGVSFPGRHGRMEEIEEKREERDGMPAKEDKRVSVESFGKPEAYFFRIQLICYCYIIFIFRFLSLPYSFIRRLIQYCSHLTSSLSRLPANHRKTRRQKFLNIFYKNPYISEIIFHINCADRTAEKYI